MKKILVLFTFIISCHLFSNAQVQTIVQKSHHIGETSVVQDSSGNRYAYADWQKLMRTGNYTLKSIKPGNDSTAYLLVKLDEAAKTKLIQIMPKPAETTYFTTGQKLDLFSANDIEGFKLRPKELAGKTLVINFWFIDCPPCRQEIPELNKMALSYANDPNIIFIAVALDYKSDLKKFVKENPFAYHIVEYGRHIADDYGIRTYPTNVVVDKQGVVRFHATGFGLNTPYWIKKTIDEVK
ncbi:TlpA family protein disulfide reductase [Mucilaginibacter sp. BJC16-A38]|uniref:TlpA disulfide reductase family protein n=1 Tax=Mucilaginibacter phenanthrenivorans TaxID=1234842 RepID=UPI00215772EC|nr:TlpA disulfide reductase family protein [Mucilaginibacter phenanthrenivorans]MCR8559163.1 TlpA family protein disulfide reductase [Mucilaginibacter phenanthrenivorans]